MIEQGQIMKAPSGPAIAFAFLSLASPAFAQTSPSEPPINADGGGSSSTTEEIPLNLDESVEGGIEAVEIETDQKAQGGEGDVKIEESAILPSTDDFEESEAPTMDLDCDNNNNCLDNLTSPTEGPVLSSPDATTTPDVETHESGRVVTEP